MDKCECGFNFIEAITENRKLESYAVIPDCDYEKVMMKERKILEEKDRQKKIRLIGRAAEWVGSLIRCPDCGTWCLLKPIRGTDGEDVRLKPITNPK